MEDYRGIFRAKPSNYRLINYEAEVYKLIYNRNPLHQLELNYRRPKKLHNGSYWDVMLDITVIDQLNNIDGIQIVDLNQGHGSKLLTYCVFKPNNQDQEYVQRVADKLNTLETKSKLGIGVNNTLLVYVSVKNWFRENADNTSFNKWWANLPNKIKLAIK